MGPNRNILAHDPAADVDDVDPVVAHLPVAEVPEPVPVVMHQVPVEGLLRRRSQPEVPIQPGGRRLRGLEAQRISRPGEFAARPVDPADDSVPDQFGHRAEGTAGAAVGSALDDAVVFAGSLHQLAALPDVVGEGLFHVDVLPRLAGPDSRQGVPVVAGGDGDGVDGPVVHDPSQVLLDPGPPAADFPGLFRLLQSPPFVHVADYGQFHALVFQNLFHQAPAAAAGPDQRYPDAVVGAGPGFGGSDQGGARPGGGREELSTFQFGHRDSPGGGRHTRGAPAEG